MKFTTTQVWLLIDHRLANASYTKANESGKEAQKETMGLIDIGLPQCKNEVNSNSKARIESKIQRRQVYSSAKN